ncbi:MAG TPA: arginase family protein [Thermoanaerobaculia bacterium]|jgi:arginase|nr:arginase family protein [Thermoanaerobaculia bacterium]
MSLLPLDLIAVPWDVERGDTSAARAPGELAARGFPARLRASGREVREMTVHPINDGSSKVETVAEIGHDIARAVAQARAQGRFPLVLSGGCLAAVGVVAGLQRGGTESPGVVWIDAHGDFNTPESSLSGYWDGMALATVCGVSLADLREAVGLKPLALDRAIHLAGRAFDPLETANIRRHGLELVAVNELASSGAREQIRHRAGAGGWYLHVDLDGLDPRDVPAVGFPEPDGARLDDLLEALGGLPPPAAMTFSALSFDHAGDDEAERTVAACLRLAEAFTARG